MTVGSAGYRKLVASGGTESGWASETAARDETDTPVFNEIAPPMGDLFANPAASQAMLDDAMFNVEDWLADQLGREFAVAEGSAFVTGNGTNRPKGFLTYATTNEVDSVRAFGTLQHLATGTAGAFPAAKAARTAAASTAAAATVAVATAVTAAAATAAEQKQKQKQ